MPAASFTDFLAICYYVCFAFLDGLLLLIATRRRQKTNADRHLQLAFLLLAFSILTWQFVLFVEVRAPLPAVQLWIGRFNYTIVCAAVYYAFRFVQHIPSGDNRKVPRLPLMLFVETSTLTTITLFTPLIDAKEITTTGRAITVFGPLYLMYIVHVTGYLWLTIMSALVQRSRANSGVERDQLSLVGFGFVVTSIFGITTNAVMPYWWGNFDYCDIGPLSVLILLIAIGYATLFKRLFNLRIVIKKTIVYGAMLSLVSGAYSAGLFVGTHYLTGNTGASTQFLVLFLALSFDPMRRALEKRIDRMIFQANRSGSE